MKKVLFICIVLFCFTGCGKNENKILENEMKKHVTAYYEEYMKNVSGQRENDISIADLKRANKDAGASFDLKKLESCKDTSSVTITVDNITREIQGYKFHLDCK